MAAGVVVWTGLPRDERQTNENDVEEGVESGKKNPP